VSFSIQSLIPDGHELHVGEELRDRGTQIRPRFLRRTTCVAENPLRFEVTLTLHGVPVARATGPSEDEAGCRAEEAFAVRVAELLRLPED